LFAAKTNPLLSQNPRQPEWGSVDWWLKGNPMLNATFHPKLLFPLCKHGMRNWHEKDATTERSGEAHVGEGHEPHVVFCG